MYKRQVFADDDSMTITNLVVEYYDEAAGAYKPLTSGITLNDQTKVRINFNWQFPNSSTTTAGGDYITKIDLGIDNISMDSITNVPFNDTTNAEMGKYSINSNEFTLVINKDYYDTHSNRSGKASLDGVVSVNNDDNKASTDATIAVSGNKFDIHVVFNQAESNLKVAKKTVGKATLNDDGTLNQTYQVDIACKNDNISDLVLSDEAGSALSGATNFVYNGATYGSLAELSTAIGSTMTKDQKISFTYDMKVDASVLEQGTNHYTGSETNKFKTEYKTNKGNSKTSDSNSVNLDLDMPSVSKNGTYDSTTGKVTWKITVTPGVVGWDKVDMSGVTDKVTEMLGGTALGASKDISFTKNDFTTTDNKTYTYEYTTNVSTDAQSSSSKVTAQNDVTNIQFDGHKYNTSAEVGITESNWAKKSYVSYDEASKILTWKIDVDIPTGENITDVAVNDSLYGASGNHDFNIGNLEVTLTDNTHTDATILKYTEKSNQQMDSDVLETTYTDFNKQNNLTFKDSYIASLQASGSAHMTLTFKTHITDEDPIGTYSNKGEVRYKSNGKQGVIPVSADYKFKAVSITDKRAFFADDDKETIQYNVWVDFSKDDSITPEVGKQIIFTDEMPDNMVLKSVDYLGAGQVDGWFDNHNNYQSSQLGVTDTSAEDGKVVFTVTLSQEMIDNINNAAPNQRGIYVTYTAKVKDGMKFHKGGTTTFKNKVSATYDGTSVGKKTVSSQLTPGKLVDKQMEYNTSKSVDKIFYTVDINKCGYDLASGTDVLTCEDDMGTSLILDPSTVKIKQIDDDGNSSECSSASFSYDKLNNRITFKIPDETHIQITYTVKLALYGDGTAADSDKITFENSGNTFTVKGVETVDTKDQVSRYNYAYSSKVQGAGDTGSITLLKYYRGTDGNMKPLGGSSFKIYRATYDEATGLYTYDSSATPEKEKTLRDDETEWVIDNLRLDIVYALVETGSQLGYKVNPDPMYFVLPGDDYKKVQQTSQLERIVTSSYLRYNNEKGSFQIKKTIDGSTKNLQKYEAFTFELQEINKPSISSVNGQKEITYTDKTSGVNQQITSSTATGIGDFNVIDYTASDIGKEFYYKISEKKGSNSNIAYDTSFYVATVSVKQDATTGEIYSDINSIDKYSEDGILIGNTIPEMISFNNSADMSGSLTLTKTVSGDKTFADVKDGLSFEIKGPGSYSATIKGKDLDATTRTKTLTGLVPGQYTITETITDITGFKHSTKYTVGSGSEKTGKVATATVEAKKNTEVDFVNTYTKKAGSLKLTKTVTGDKTLADVKASISFKITGSNGYSETVSGKQLDASGSYTINDLAIGDYTVTETVSGLSLIHI